MAEDAAVGHRQITVDAVKIGIASEVVPPAIVVRNARVTIPRAALDEIVRAAPIPGQLQISVELEPGRLIVKARVALLRANVAFRPSIERGNLVLTPTGGIPGMLLGFAAGHVSGRPGVSMSGDGVVTIDPRAFCPPGVTLPDGLTGVEVTPERITVTAGTSGD